MTVVLLFNICFFFILYSTSALGALLQPKNLRLVSFNLGSVLEWDAPDNTSTNPSYTAEFRSPVQNYTSVCSNTTERVCDFTMLLSRFGVYRFRVRTELQGEASPWVETPTDFLPDKDTNIGPPTVKLDSKDGGLEVSIQDPVLKTSTLKDVYSKISYNIMYWKEGEEDKVQERTDHEQEWLILSQLEPWTTYCLQAQVSFKGYRNNGELSSVKCKATTSSGKVESWVVALVLVGSFLATAVFVSLVFLMVWYSYKGLKFFYPNVRLPEHFKQYLMEPPRSYIFLAMQNIPQEREEYHTIVIVSEGLEEAVPNGQEPDHMEVLGREQEMEKEKDLLLQLAGGLLSSKTEK